MEKGKGSPSRQDRLDRPGGLRTPGSVLGVGLSGKSRKKDWPPCEAGSSVCGDRV